MRNDVHRRVIVQEGCHPDSGGADISRQRTEYREAPIRMQCTYETHALLLVVTISLVSESWHRQRGRHAIGAVPSEVLFLDPESIHPLTSGME